MKIFSVKLTSSDVMVDILKVSFLNLSEANYYLLRYWISNIKSTL